MAPASKERIMKQSKPSPMEKLIAELNKGISPREFLKIAEQQMMANAKPDRKSVV